MDTNVTDNAVAKAGKLPLYFPEDGPTNFWMYAVIAAGTAFIVFVAVALYSVCRSFQAEHHRSRLESMAPSSEANTTLLPTTRPYDILSKDQEPRTDTNHLSNQI